MGKPRDLKPIAVCGLTLLLAGAAALSPGWNQAAAQEESLRRPVEVRVAARLLPEGWAEMALQTRDADGVWSERRELRRRHLPAGTKLGRWLSTAPFTLDGLDVRIDARRLTDGRVEVALRARFDGSGWRDRVLPERRYLPEDLEPGRWLLSSPSTFTPHPAQIVSFYGFPTVPAMGVLGHGTPDKVAERIRAWADRYNSLNGPRNVVPAYHLIVGVAQAYPTPDGLWLGRLSDHGIAAYVEAARKHGLLLFLDTQIGWSEPLAEVQLLEPFLREPFVHVALDPEFATEHRGVRPGLAIGSVTGDQVNEVQRYLADLVRQDDLPPKILMVHQFAERMITDRSAIEDHPEIELSIDMDGFGVPSLKLRHYNWYALTEPSERPAFKLFFDQDTPIMTPEEVQDLDRPPDIIIYQ